eukprot:6720636-Alexandrium_andersonii.AAC.1
MLALAPPAQGRAATGHGANQRHRARGAASPSGLIGAETASPVDAPRAPLAATALASAPTLAPEPPAPDKGAAGSGQEGQPELP